MDDLAAILASADAAEVAAAVRAVDDAALRDALRDPELRRTAVAEVFARMPDFLEQRADEEAALTVDGERWVVDLRSGAARVDPAAASRVGLTLDAPTFLRVVTGGADTATMWLTGQIELEGDEPYALELAALFRLPSDGRVDPLDIDVPKIAGVIGDVPDKQLKARLSGGLRDLVLGEIFRRAPEYLRADKAGGSNGAAKFVLTGRADGEADRYEIALADGTVTAGAATTEDPRVTIRLDGADFLKLVTSNMNPVMATMRGKIKLKGDVAFAAGLLKVFAIPRAG